MATPAKAISSIIRTGDFDTETVTVSGRSTPVRYGVPGFSIAPEHAPPRRVAADEVTALIDAAGPLSLKDIAAGLSATVREAASVVWRMLDDGSLRTDEWSRHALVGTGAGD
jgi:hypothetical protein